jgi:hypothetical protein
MPSSVLLSIFLLTAPTLSAPAQADDGMWHPAGQDQASTWAPTATLAAASWKSSETATKATTKAVAATVATPVAGADWQTAVTWPAGCELWANPCPPGAKIAGATGTASYENPFTSYTTMTDENGVITGMPPKATVAAGVTAKSTSNSSVTLKTLTSTSGSSTTVSGFNFGSSATARPSTVTTNGAAGLRTSFLLGAVAVVAALL